jgi:tetratricopeptide (TPR) repeat protein
MAIMRKELLHNPVVHILFIVFICIVAYSNTFQASFHYDDIPAIVENPIIKELGFFADPSGAEDYKGRFEYPNLKSRYIGYLTLALNYRLHGLDVTGYHVFNLFIHILTAFIIYHLVILSFRTPLLHDSGLRDQSKQIAFVTSLLFACHPIQTQAVTYIVQRVASLATMFYLLSLFLYAKWRLPATDRDHQKNNSAGIRLLPFYAASIISAVLAMKTKETAFTLPVMILLYESFFFEGKVKRRLLYQIPFLFTMLIIPITLLSIDKPVGELIGDIDLATRDYMEISRKDYFITQFSVLVTYIRLIFLPIKQNLEYDYAVYSSFFEPRVLFSSLVLFAILLLALYLFKRSKDNSSHGRLISYGILWFFITLSVESSVIPIPSVIFEHRMYLASFGVFIALTTAVFVLKNRISNRWRYADIAIAGLIAITIITLTAATYERNKIWRDEITLWEDVISKNPLEERAFRNLGIAYRQRGMFDKAIELQKKAIELDPDNAEAHNNLGFAYYSKGLLGKAIEHYRKALKLIPQGYKIHNNLAIAYEESGNIDKAIEHYSFAVKLNPDFALGHYNLGHLFLVKKSFLKAIEHFQAAIRIDPGYVEAHNDLANIYAIRGDLDEAIRHFEITIKLNPDLPDTYYNLGLTYQKKSLLDKAIESFQNVVRLTPDAGAYNKLGEIYISQGMFNKAEENIASAIKLKPDWATPHYNLGLVCYKKGETDRKSP